ncbi:MAG TPA: site-specific DNA-methyltransferase [Candidatus Thermoplasmatota archaeon]|nr:site-specific DNA-methyltransferase [Candidatus Thermoplasmatota archaeon]
MDQLYNHTGASSLPTQWWEKVLISSHHILSPQFRLEMTCLKENRTPSTKISSVQVHWKGKQRPRAMNRASAHLTEIYDPQRTVKAPPSFSYDALKKDWHNLLFQGDNARVLDLLLSNGFRERIDFVYIDPPFNSGSEYVRMIKLRGSATRPALLQQTAYEDTWDTPSYLQFMYERLLKLRDLLKNTGFLCVHLDYHVGHYVKLVLDEVFGQENFRNELVVKRVYKNLQGQFTEIKSLPQGHDVIYCYSKHPETRFKPVMVAKQQVNHPEGYWKEFWSGADRPTMRYPVLGVTPAAGQWKWKKTRAHQAVDNYLEYQRNHTPDTLSLYKYWVQTGCDKEFIRKSSTGKIEHWVPPSDQKFLDTVWSDIASYSFDHGFRTEKSEELLERLLAAFSKPRDLVLDVFAGSGTTARVAQRLGRRWIACDVHPIAVRMTSRLLQQVIGEQLRTSTTRNQTFLIYQVHPRTQGKRHSRSNPPVRATMTVESLHTNAIRVTLETFESSILLKSPSIRRNLLKDNIPDFRSMIDGVLIDPEYDGAVFHASIADVPVKKNALVKGTYEVGIPRKHSTIGVKILAVTGEEALLVQKI